MSGESVDESIWGQLADLKEKVLAAKVDITLPSMFEIACAHSGEVLSPIRYFTEKETFMRAAAVAEIFRYAMLVYVLRIIHPPSSTLIPEIQDAVQSAIDLFPLVPDVIGPGSNLGWAYVVIGVELTEAEQREYIWCRLQSLHSLALQNVDSAEKVLKAAWKNRDDSRLGLAEYGHWQDLMRILDIEQILI